MYRNKIRNKITTLVGPTRSYENRQHTLRVSKRVDNNEGFRRADRS